jgi:hypothetical protein
MRDLNLDHVMTARELRDHLNTLTDEELMLPIMTEGCDCTGPSDGLEYLAASHGEPAAITINRQPSSRFL